MKRKLSVKAITALLLLSNSIVTALACTASLYNGSTCGTSSNPTVYNGCVNTDCSTQDQTCGGPTTDYYCQTGPSTATCQCWQYTKVQVICNGVPCGYACDLPRSNCGTSSAPCHVVTQEVVGCR